VTYEIESSNNFSGPIQVAGSDYDDICNYFYVYNINGNNLRRSGVSSGTIWYHAKFPFL